MNKKLGFTLIELVIVVAIIAIMAVLGGANYISSLQRSRDSRRMADLGQVRASLEMYRTDNDEYPIGTDYEDMTDVLYPDYLKSVPSDPLGTAEYSYESDGSTYELCATLEKTTPPSDCEGTGIGNYGVTEP